MIFFQSAFNYKTKFNTPNKRNFQQIASNHSSDINFKDFMKPHKDYSKEPYSFLVNDAALPSDNSLRFRNNLF